MDYAIKIYLLNGMVHSLQMRNDHEQNDHINGNQSVTVVSSDSSDSYISMNDADPNGSGKSTITCFFDIVGIYTNAEDMVAATGMSNEDAARLAEK